MVHFLEETSKSEHLLKMHILWTYTLEQPGQNLWSYSHDSALTSYTNYSNAH